MSTEIQATPPNGKGRLCFPGWSRLAAVVLVIGAISVPGRTQLPAQPLSLTLNQCVEKALRENLDLSIELLNPEMQTLSLKEAREKFLPQFYLSYRNSDTNQPGTWSVEGEIVKTKSDNITFNLNQRLIWGTALNLSVNNSMADTTRANTFINPSYASRVTLDLTQPLLRGFGAKYGRYEATKAERNRAIADTNLTARALDIVFQVEQAYWNLVQSRESLRVQELSLVNSREMLLRTREAARIGTKLGIDVVNSETDVADWEDRVLTAKRTVQMSEDTLRSLLNLPAGGEDPMIPLDQPTVEKREISVERLLQTALDHRPEMEVYRRRLENSASDIDYSRNQSLPQLDLRVSLWSPGQSGVRNVYDPYTGLLLSRIVGGRADSFSDIIKGKNKNWDVTLSLTVPLANLLSRTSLARAQLSRDQTQIEFEKQRRAIEFEVHNTIRELQAKERKIESSAHSRELQEKRVAAETQRYLQGLVGSDWLFTYQRNLADAKSAEIRAVIDYKITLARLDRATGTTTRFDGTKIR